MKYDLQRRQNFLNLISATVLAMEPGQRFEFTYSRINMEMQVYRHSMKEDLVEAIPGSGTDEVLVEFNDIEGWMRVTMQGAAH